MRALPITGEYPPNWKAISDATWAAAGHRCIRCGHPYRKGEHGKGQWTRCDSLCLHGGPLAVLRNGDIEPTRLAPRNAIDAMAEFDQVGIVVAEWRIGTVHHLDGDKANCRWWNLLALCQRCHLKIQSRVNPQQPYMFSHSEWFKPYVAGFYAWKYEQRDITRVQAMSELDRLLALERIA